MDTAIDIAFGDADYRFWLAMPQIIELERRAGQKRDDGTLAAKSAVAIFEGLNDSLGLQDGSIIWVGGGDIFANDVNEVVRLGLIGGGEGPLRARELVDLYGYPARPLVEVAGIAWRVLRAAILGVEVKKKDEQAEPEPIPPLKKGK